MKKFVEVSCMVSLLCARRTLASDICSVYSASKAQGGNGEGVCGGVAEQFTGKSISFENSLARSCNL